MFCFSSDILEVFYFWGIFGSLKRTHLFWRKNTKRSYSSVPAVVTSSESSAAITQNGTACRTTRVYQSTLAAVGSGDDFVGVAQTQGCGREASSQASHLHKYVVLLYFGNTYRVECG